MSTYTDIQNRIKENIVAKTDDRTVSAKTVFVNPENVYYGTFIGGVDASSLTLPDGFLSGLSFDNPVLVNPTLSSFVDSPENGVSVAKLDFSDLQAVSCAMRDFKNCLLKHFSENDPTQYDGEQIVSAFIDLKHCLSGF